MNKKIIAGLTAVALVAAMALPAAAAAPTGDTQTTTLTSFKESAYTLTIPASSKDVTYGTESTAIGSLKVVGNVDVDDSVTVSATLNDFVRTGSTDDKIAFSLMDHSEEPAKDFAATTWSETELRAETAKEIRLTVDIPTDTWNAAKAGSYTGSIVFTAAYNSTHNA